MIHEYVQDLAAHMCIELSTVSVVDGEAAGCLDVYLLHLSTKGQLASALVYQSEIDTLQSGGCCDKLELRIRAALSHLKLLLKNNKLPDFWTTRNRITMVSGPRRVGRAKRGAALKSPDTPTSVQLS